MAINSSMRVKPSSWPALRLIRVATLASIGSLLGVIF